MSLKSVVMGDDRETSIKQQIVSVHKALNKNEVPLKHKHARQVIMGTHKEKSCTIFWNLNISGLLPSPNALSEYSIISLLITLELVQIGVCSA
ncbi:unnamed protein product [Gongylonema pulchrum]|uniref:ANTH domain-containing protein n=1 Tax=Gongylonema pulchrum TaxID=637853 RepID=A0A183EVK2_9BILA|nr:unnamed protein product [Gongylonema pulchrum]